MKITVTEKARFLPGDTVYLRVFGGGPYVFIQKGDDMVVDSCTLDPMSKGRRKTWKTTKYVVHETSIVCDKKGNYVQYPTAALTTDKPSLVSDTIAMTLLIFSTTALVTAPFWAVAVSLWNSL